MLIDYFVRGGALMWPILGASVVALAVVLERVRHLWRTRGDARGLREEILALVESGRPAEARQACARSRQPVGAVLGAGLSGWGLELEEVERRLELAAAEQVEAAETRLPLLATMIGILPMLGFAGTILGLMGAFSAWASAGAEVTLEQLSGGISEAMITTAAGLITSIPYLVAYNALAGEAAAVARDCNAAASELVGRLRSRCAHRGQAVEPLILSVGGAR